MHLKPKKQFLRKFSFFLCFIFLNNLSFSDLVIFKKAKLTKKTVFTEKLGKQTKVDFIDGNKSNLYSNLKKLHRFL